MGVLYSTIIYRPPYPSQSFAGRNIIVTGSNSGIGREAARHFARLGASRVILAVRNVKAGEEAKRDIVASTKRANVVDVWELDLARYASVKAFAAKAERELKRLDIVILNAAVATGKYETPEGLESHVTVNVVSTFMLMVLLLPLQRKTAKSLAPTEARPHTSLVGSGIHRWVKLLPSVQPEDKVLSTLSDEAKSAERINNIPANYIYTKKIQAMLTREIASRLSADEVIFSSTCPGLVRTGLRRELTGLVATVLNAMARTPEVGSRTVLAAAEADKESHGKWFHDAIAQNDESSSGYGEDILSTQGKDLSERVWREIEEILQREGVDIVTAFK
jgi:NAD(P)-dependent dehydrogenase (short-subunit alcohol dehydrogenase family)